MISNNVEFNIDPNDGMYVATIKIVNKNPTPPPAGPNQ